MRRTTLIAITVAALFMMLPATAMAWCNGPAVGGKAGNGYGSHDWILDHAIKLAGADGAWVVRKTALLGSDDPDSQNWPAADDHFFESGSCRGAPYMVGELYHRAVVAYQAGDMATASKALGQLSHCYSDILQPFHSASAASAHKTLHVEYEYAVEPHQRKYASSASWITPRARVDVTDVRDKTISAGLYGRSFYSSLYASFKKSHSVKKGTPLAITKKLMSRAVNDLADIVRGIKSGSGEAAAPAAVNMTLSRTTPRQNENVGAFITLADASGRPLNAVDVKFVWHLPSGAVSYQTFTDANGEISKYENIGKSPLSKQCPVSTYVTVNGKTTVSTCWYTPKS